MWDETDTINTETVTSGTVSSYSDLVYEKQVSPRTVVADAFLPVTAQTSERRKPRKRKINVV